MLAETPKNSRKVSFIPWLQVLKQT